MRMKSVLSVLAPAVLFVQVGAASATTTCGAAYFSHDINWPSSSPLYFSVAGAPPNTCGDLWANRNNGGWVQGGDWICTDSNGIATKGPWNSNPDDETAYVYIDWGTCISPAARHVWDVGAPSADITSSVPGAFSGTATDEAWGAGFNASWSSCLVEYIKEATATTGQRWWSSSTSGYSAANPVYVGCSLSGMPAMSVTWSTTSTNGRPSAQHHVSGAAYTWKVWVFDGGQWGIDSVSFVY
jgi:hypothetical protein